MNDTKIDAECGAVSAVGMPPSLIVNGPKRCEVSDPTAFSTSSVTADGRIRVRIDGMPVVGRKAEPRVIKVLAQVVSGKPGVAGNFRLPTNDEDQQGHDGFIAGADGQWQSVQCVSVPNESTYAHQLAVTGKSEITLDPDGAADWIAAAIQDKAGQYASADKAAVILALDLRHHGPFVDEPVLAALRRNHPAALNHGFREVWLVGPIPERCVRL